MFSCICICSISLIIAVFQLPPTHHSCASRRADIWGGAHQRLPTGAEDLGAGQRLCGAERHPLSTGKNALQTLLHLEQVLWQPTMPMPHPRWPLACFPLKQPSRWAGREGPSTDTEVLTQPAEMGMPFGVLYTLTSSPGIEAKAMMLLTVLEFIFLVCRPQWRRRCGSQRA